MTAGNAPAVVPPAPIFWASARTDTSAAKGSPSRLRPNNWEPIACYYACQVALRLLSKLGKGTPWTGADAAHPSAVADQKEVRCHCESPETARVHGPLPRQIPAPSVFLGARPMDRIEGRTALVTGAASGIGLSIATALVTEGARVILADQDDAALSRACAALCHAARPCQLDVTDRSGWERAKRFAEDTFGPVEILVNNAGVGPDWHELADMPADHFDRLVGIMLTGVFNGIHAFGSAIRSLGEGHILNTASMVALAPMAQQGAYVAAKCGVVGLSEVLRAEMEPYGVGVSVLCPARVRTNLLSGNEPPHRTMNGGMDPALVADYVINGIRSNEFYIITHPEYGGLVKDRADTLLDSFERAETRH